MRKACALSRTSTRQPSNNYDLRGNDYILQTLAVSSLSRCRAMSRAMSRIKLEAGAVTPAVSGVTNDC